MIQSLIDGAGGCRLTFETFSELKNIQVFMKSHSMILHFYEDSWKSHKRIFILIKTLRSHSINSFNFQVSSWFVKKVSWSKAILYFVTIYSVCKKFFIQNQFYNFKTSLGLSRSHFTKNISSSRSLFCKFSSPKSDSRVTKSWQPRLKQIQSHFGLRLHSILLSFRFSHDHRALRKILKMIVK